MDNYTYILGVSGGFSPGNHDPAVALTKIIEVHDLRIFKVHYAGYLSEFFMTLYGINGIVVSVIKKVN